MSAKVSQDELLIARIMFVNRLLKANGQAFQQLFWAVMRALHGQSFVEVRPQGAKGDGGNDGFHPETGHYYQVYGPIDPEEKVQTAADKLATDFAKLQKSWNDVTPIKAFSFVYNDKYEGTFIDIVKALQSINKQHPGISCTPFTAGHLESLFMNLSSEGKQAVLGAIIPDPSRILTVDYGVLKEVIAHIMTSPASSSPTRFGDLPDLSEKIELNNLCSTWSDLLRKGARHAGHVDSYFAKNSTFLKQALRDHLVNIYSSVRDALKATFVKCDGLSIEDLVFDDFRTHLLSRDSSRAVEDAVEILIGYYFESCDVFDPKADKGSPSASP